MRITLQLARTLNDNNLLREYATWLSLKHQFVNGVYYEGNNSYIAKNNSLSRNTIKKYIDFFIKEGWCVKLENGAISFISHKKLSSKYKISTSYWVNLNNTKQLNPHSVTNIITIIRYHLLKEKHDSYHTILEMSRNLFYPTGTHAAAKLKKAKRFFQNRPGVLPIKDVTSKQHYQASVFSLSNNINLSISSISKLTKQLKHIKLLKITYNTIKKKTANLNNPSFSIHASISKQFNKDDYYANARLFNGYLFITKPNYYQFLN